MCSYLRFILALPVDISKHGGNRETIWRQMLSSGLLFHFCHSLTSTMEHHSTSSGTASGLLLKGSRFFRFPEDSHPLSTCPTSTRRSQTRSPSNSKPPLNSTSIQTLRPASRTLLLEFPVQGCCATSRSLPMRNNLRRSSPFSPRVPFVSSFNGTRPLSPVHTPASSGPKSCRL